MPGMTKEERMKVEDKSKKRKNFSFDDTIVVTKSRDEDNAMKNKKKHKIAGRSEPSRRSTEFENAKGYVEVDDDLRVVKGPKKKKISICDPTNELVQSLVNDDDVVPNNDGGVRKEKDPMKKTDLESAKDVNSLNDKIQREKEKNENENPRGKNIESSEVVNAQTIFEREACVADIAEKVDNDNRKIKDDLHTNLQEDEKSGDKILTVADEILQDGEGNANYSTVAKGKKIESVENSLINPNPTGKSTKVRNAKEKNGKEDMVQGKRFSKKEDEILKKAVYAYIKEHKLGAEGLKMVLNCVYYPELKNCWREIGECLPHRPNNSIYYRAHILFETIQKGTWTKEECERIREFQAQNGNQWKILASELGRSRLHVKDTWRRIKLPDIKHGQWTQEEYQNLFNLVNLDLKLKAEEEKKSKHGMLRDNIAWSAISDKLSTRDNSACCQKWYRQLSSSMVADGKWSDGDDYRLIDALFKLDACCIEDVEWDKLMSHRSGDLCKKRWDQMVLHIGEHGTKSFGEQVDILSKRYCPDLGDVREAWDKKPVVL